jgi:hypothetical protein
VAVSKSIGVLRVLALAGILLAGVAGMSHAAFADQVEPVGSCLDGGGFNLSQTEHVIVGQGFNEIDATESVGFTAIDSAESVGFTAIEAADSTGFALLEAMESVCNR